MKRQFLIRLLALCCIFILCMAPVGVSAAEAEGETRAALLSWYREKVDAEAEDSMFRAVLAAFADGVEFYKVYSEDETFLDELVYLRLGEAVMQFPDSATYVAYADGTVYTLTGAYEAGVLTGPVLEKGNFAGSVLDVFAVGDVDFDGFISVSDVVALRQFIVQGWGGAGTADCMDVNGDGSVTVSDVVTLRSRVVEG